MTAPSDAHVIPSLAIQPTGRTVAGTSKNAVNAVVGTFATVFGTLEDTITLAGKAVNTAKRTQAIDCAARISTHMENTMLRTTAEQVKIQKEVLTFFSQDPANQNLFESSYAKLQLAMQAELQAA